MKNNFILVPVLIGMVVCAPPILWAHGSAPDCAVLLKMSDKDAYARGPVLEAIRKECAKDLSEETEKTKEVKAGHAVTEASDVESDGSPKRR